MIIHSGSAPQILQCDGSYAHSHGVLQWTIPMVDASNKTGTLEFGAVGSPEAFFPVNVAFSANKPFCDITVSTVVPPNTAAHFKSQIGFLKGYTPSQYRRCRTLITVTIHFLKPSNSFSQRNY